MNSRNSRFLQRVLSSFLIILPLVFPVLAQEDTDPNSPTPVLLSESNSTRALAYEPNSSRLDKRLSKEKSRAFSPGSKIVIYTTNLDLMDDEGANAFRLYIQDKSGKKYRFPILEITPVQGLEWVYAVTVELRDEIGYWEPPTADGDVLIRLAWRGLSSNAVRLGLGKIGGDIKDEKGAVPTPLSNYSVKPAMKLAAPEAVGYRWSSDRMRFLEQATFGPTPALDSRIRRIGLRTWLAEQFEAPYPSANNPYPNIPLKNSDARNATSGCGMFLDAMGNSTPEYNVCTRDHYSQYPLQNWFFKEAFYGDAQLRHRVAWALSQIWVTSGVDIQQSSHMIEWHKTLSKHAFGNYRNLMKDMTLNPAMGDYLDMARSTRNNPNENYPREILQLFSIGLFMLNQDGTVQVDSQGVPIPSYDQTTVNNFTKVLTGWGFCNNTTNPACSSLTTTGTVNFKDPLLLNQNNHDVTAKTLLNYPNARNTSIAAGLNGNTEIDLALDNIFYHPNVAPFVSKLLIQHLVTSDPTPAYVGRVAAVFNNNGSGGRGDLKAVVRAILLDAEARGDVKTDANFGKLREPVQLLTNLFRGFNVRSASGTQPSDGVVAGLTTSMAQNVFYAPTVFNYYSPDYVIPGTSLLGPEFNIMTTGTAIARANFVNTMVFSRINTSGNVPLGTSIDLSEMQALATADTTSNQLLDALNQKMMRGTMSASMRGAIMTAVQAVPSTSPLARAQQAIYLIATSSQYQVQR